VAAAALVMAPFVIAAGRDALSFVDYQFQRGLQVESAGGGLVLLAHILGAAPATIGFSHYSFEADSSWSASIITALTPILVVAYGLMVVAATVRFRQERARLGDVRPGTVVAYVTAALLLLLLTNKVFSPQYLLWMLPFGALLPRPQAYLLMVACLLTTAVFPLNYDALLKLRPELVLLVNVRNLLLLGLMAWLLAGHAPAIRPRRRRVVS